MEQEEKMILNYFKYCVKMGIASIVGFALPGTALQLFRFVQDTATKVKETLEEVILQHNEESIADWMRDVDSLE